LAIASFNADGFLNLKVVVAILFNVFAGTLEVNPPPII
jgi:hypothetical protein